MKLPKLNKKAATAAGGTFAAIAILLIVIFATPLLGTDKVGKFSTSDPSIGGWVGKIPSPAYSSQ
jgi:hypothetical protein